MPTNKMQTKTLRICRTLSAKVSLSSPLWGRGSSRPPRSLSGWWPINDRWRRCRQLEADRSDARRSISLTTKPEEAAEGEAFSDFSSLRLGKFCSWRWNERRSSMLPRAERLVTAVVAAPPLTSICDFDLRRVNCWL